MEITNGKMCGICGKYIEMPTFWSGTLPTLCNGQHHPISHQIQFSAQDGLIVAKLDEIIQLLKLIKN